MRETEMRRIGGWIREVLGDPGNAALLGRIREEVRELCGSFPLYEELAGVR
jgi:glycine hydroxymethyltransferase